MLGSVPEEQILCVNLVGVAQGKSAFQYVFQFPYVTGEVITLEVADGSGC